jgi:hypothetical protein
VEGISNGPWRVRNRNLIRDYGRRPIRTGFLRSGNKECNASSQDALQPGSKAEGVRDQEGPTEEDRS